MPVNYDELFEINKTIEKFHNSKLQIVTKNRDEKIVKELIDNGYYLFGENKVQEAQEKFKNINNPNVELHLIGPLQTNKVRLALQLFHCIQSIDRPKLVNEISKQQQKITTKTEEYFIQVNIGKEPQKSGIHPDDLSNLYDLCIMKNLKITGLMCIPPADKPGNFFFNEMVSLRDKLNESLTLSMGMSNDYKLALKNNSNLIRIGSRIFN